MSQAVALPRNQNSLLTMFLVSLLVHVAAIALIILMPSILPRHASVPFGGNSGAGGLDVNWVNLNAGKITPVIKPQSEEEAAPSKTIEKLMKEDQEALASKLTLPEISKKKEEKPQPKETLNQPERKANGTFGAGKNTQKTSGVSGAGNAGKFGVGAFGTGTQGSGGTGTTGTGIEFPFPWYVDRVMQKIDMNWVKPYISNPANALETVVYFVITRDGQVRDVKVEKSSGIDMLDRSAESAIESSTPFPPLPPQWTEPDLAFRLTFRYTQ
jgi:colicin import membrane protein